MQERSHPAWVLCVCILIQTNFIDFFSKVGAGGLDLLLSGRAPWRGGGKPSFRSFWEPKKNPLAPKMDETSLFWGWWVAPTPPSRSQASGSKTNFVFIFGTGTLPYIFLGFRGLSPSLEFSVQQPTDVPKIFEVKISLSSELALPGDPKKIELTRLETPPAPSLSLIGGCP